MAKILVTGAAGFIGSSLVRELCKRGHDVRGIDNLSTGDLANLSGVLNQIDFHEADIRDEKLIRSLCCNVDIIFHEAALPSASQSVSDPVTSHRANVDGTLSVLLAARDSGVQRIIYASSASAYGDSQTLPKQETMPVSPVSPCAAQKVAAELYMESFARTYGIETVSLRYFNVFGPRQAADSLHSAVLARFITSMLSGIIPVIYGDGTQSRDFTYIENVVHANLLAAWAPADTVSGKVYNIACGENYSLLETYYLLAHLIGIRKQPAFGPPRDGDIHHSLASIEKARQELGYFPIVGFEDGLSRTIDWYATKLGVAAELTSIAV